jgi:hypothetical protein
MTIDHQAADALALKNFIAVRVRYVGSAHAYLHQGRMDETLAELKPTVLHHFGLVEGNVDGGSKVYEFSVHDELQTDLSVTLRTLSHGHHELAMHLLEKFTQG